MSFEPYDCDYYDHCPDRHCEGCKQNPETVFGSCSVCGDSLPEGDLKEFGGSSYCIICYYDTTFPCPECGERTHLDNAGHFEGDRVCIDCREELLDRKFARD